jgi:hypothetical protein
VVKRMSRQNMMPIQATSDHHAYRSSFDMFILDGV